MTAAHPESTQRFDVVIAGGGVAGLEAAFALHELAGERVAVTLVSPGAQFAYRPPAVAEPFGSGHVERYALAPLVAAAGAALVRDTVDGVDRVGRTVRTAGGVELPYDALILAMGATPHPLSAHVTTVDAARMDTLLHGLVQDIEGGYVRRLGIVIPGPMCWPFPAYELALMASERAWDMQTDLDVVLFTPEHAPLEAFGAAASHALATLLDDRRIEVVTSADCEVPRSGMVVVHPGGRSVALDRVVALPRLSGPRLPGVPSNGEGFIPVDEHGRVRELDHVWAAGDGTDHPVKLGGVAAQLADAAARSIAIQAGVPLDARPVTPVLEGVLMTGGTPRYLRHTPPRPGNDGESVFTEVTPETRGPKISARYLGPHLVTGAHPPFARRRHPSGAIPPTAR